MLSDVLRDDLLDLVLARSNVAFRTGKMVGGASIPMDGAHFRMPQKSFEVTDARGAGVELRIYGCDPDQAEARARELGFTVLSGAMDKPHGLRECVILDDDGYAWVPAVALPRR